MSDPATLLGGIAAIITSLSGGVIGVLAVKGGSKRERKSAAKGALDRVFGAGESDDDDDTQADRATAYAEILEELMRRRADEQKDGDE